MLVLRPHQSEKRDLKERCGFSCLQSKVIMGMGDPTASLRSCDKPLSQANGDENDLPLWTQRIHPGQVRLELLKEPVRQATTFCRRRDSLMKKVMIIYVINCSHIVTTSRFFSCQAFELENLTGAHVVVATIMVKSKPIGRHTSCLKP